MLLRLSLGMFAGALLSASAQEQALDEYQVKAAFLYNFVKFVEWPQSAVLGPFEPIGICVIGEDPFGSALEETVNGKLVGGRPLRVRRILNAHGAADCRILFVSASERKHLSAILDGVKGSSLLTVGESDGFTSAGGIVNFKVEDGKVRFEINVQAAQRNDLRISSKLLSLAEKVTK